jgi:hypothetical protein
MAFLLSSEDFDSHSPRSQPERTRREDHLNFYALRDKLGERGQHFGLK